MVKTIIFDFDGTIADSLECVVNIVNKNSDNFGYKKITKEDIPYLQGRKPREILSHLGISIFKLPSWIKKIHSDINKEIMNLKPTVDILPILLKLKQTRQFQIGILTSNTQDNVKIFLEKNNLNFFDFIYIGKSVFGKSHIINKILKQKRIEKIDVFYICDEIRDIDAAKKSNVKTIAVTWGYNSKNALRKEEPDFLIDLPTELEKILEL